MSIVAAQQPQLRHNLGQDGSAVEDPCLELSDTATAMARVTFEIEAAAR